MVIELQDDLLSHAVLLKEANAISVELRKKVGHLNLDVFVKLSSARVFHI